MHVINADLKTFALILYYTVVWTKGVDFENQNSPRSHCSIFAKLQHNDNI